MSDETALFVYTVEIVVGIILAVYGGVLVWLVQRLLRLEDTQKEENAEINQSLAVLSKSHEELKEETRRYDKRNEIQHDRIENKLDDHNRNVMNRMDNLIKLVRNGNGKA